MIDSKGNTDPEVERVYERALALCQGMGETRELFGALTGLRVFHHMRGELQTAYNLGQRALALAERIGDDTLLLVAHGGLGNTLANQGELHRALEHLEQAIQLHDPSENRSRSFGPGIHSRSHASRTLFLLGYPDRARHMIRETIELARDGDPPTLALLLAFAATLHYRLCERDRTRECAEEAIAIARKRGYPFTLALATAYRGWALGGAQGLEEIHEGLAQFVAAGAESSIPHGVLAEAYRKLGRADDALAELEAAFAAQSEARTYEAELHRSKGEILLEQDAAEEAERCFHRALEVAREQAAKSLELRAATSLARLLRDQGKRDEARALLAPVYDWFTEGFDTADLRDAKALLDEL